MPRNDFQYVSSCIFTFTDSVGFKIISLVFRKQTVHGHGIRTWYKNFDRRKYFTLRGIETGKTLSPYDILYDKLYFMMWIGIEEWFFYYEYIEASMNYV